MRLSVKVGPYSASVKQSKMFPSLVRACMCFICLFVSVSKVCELW